MSSTSFLAELFGAVAAIIAFAAICQRKVMLDVIKGLATNRTLLYVLGVIDICAATAALLVHHDVNGSTLSIIVTLLGVALLLKGFLRLTLSEKSIKWLVKSLRIEKGYYWYMLLILVLGVTLAWAGMMPVSA